MNNSYYQNPMYPNNSGLPNQQAMPKYDATGNPNAMYNVGGVADEQYKIKNIIRDKIIIKKEREVYEIMVKLEKKKGKHLSAFLTVFLILFIGLSKMNLLIYWINVNAVIFAKILVLKPSKVLA